MGSGGLCVSHTGVLYYPTRVSVSDEVPGDPTRWWTGFVLLSLRSSGTRVVLSQESLAGSVLTRTQPGGIGTGRVQGLSTQGRLPPSQCRLSFGPYP